MLSGLPSSLFSLLLASASVVHAVNLSVHVRTSLASHGLHARDNKSIIPVHNTRNAEYIANVTLGGREIPVLLDTGRCARSRSRLPYPKLIILQLGSLGDRLCPRDKGSWKVCVCQLRSGEGSGCVSMRCISDELLSCALTGDINSADLDFAGYHIPNQAYCVFSLPGHVGVPDLMRSSARE